MNPSGQDTGTRTLRETGAHPREVFQLPVHVAARPGSVTER
ncbi:hypothetical protein [Nocardia sp. NPDC051570]